MRAIPALLLVFVVCGLALALGAAEPDAPESPDRPVPDTRSAPEEAEAPVDPLSYEGLKANPRFKRIPGTRIHMIRPSGFVAAKDFVGLESVRGRASIVVTEEPTPYAGLADTYSDEALKKLGMLLISREPASDGATDGELVVYRTQGKGTIRQFWTRYFGGRSRRFIITASSSRKRAADYDEEFKQALRSARFRLRDPDFDPFEGLPFDIPGQREMAFAKRTRDQVTFTRDGRLPLRSPEDPAFVVMVAAELVSEGDRPEYCVRQLQEGKELDKFRIVAANRIELDGLLGCESLAHGTDGQSGSVLTVYQAALFGSEELYLFKGRMGARYQTPWLARMRDMVVRFRRR